MNNSLNQFVLAAIIFVAAMIGCISLHNMATPLLANLCTWAFAGTIIVHAIVMGRKATFSIAFSVWFLMMTIPSVEPLAPLLHLKPIFASIAPDSQDIAADAFCIFTSTAFGLSVSLMFGDNWTSQSVASADSIETK